MSSSPAAYVVHLLCADDLRLPSWRASLTGTRRAWLGRAAGRWLATPDPALAAEHAELVADAGAWHLRAAAASVVDGQAVAPGGAVPLRDGALLELGRSFFLFRAAPHDPAAEASPDTLSPAWQAQLASIDRLARARLPVLIEGESGAGKDVLARLIHARSGRRGPLVSLNCAALPEHLLEDELFGHVRGAFSGAVAGRDGLVRAAHGGTLFLDEIGDMPAALQARLLRVLEDARVRPLGGEAEHAVDVRVLAATHRDLRARAAAGAFRHDLLARLGLLPIRVPALRERREDLGLLIRALLDGALGDVQLAPDAARAVLRHRWPLNVRELRGALLAAVALARDDAGRARIELAHLPAELRRPGAPPRALTDTEAAQRAQLVGLLAAHRGNVAAVARALGNKRTNVQRLMARLGVERRADSRVTELPTDQ
jgi:transcriptional regulator with GAF, ATPase, and Fis domain